jgi:hypothetical protein
MKEYLKVKICSLAEEAKIIRKFENQRKRKASYARDMWHSERRIRWYEAEITRLQKAITENTAVSSVWITQNVDLAQRIQCHRLEIQRIRRQHNNSRVSEDNIKIHEKVRADLHEHRLNVVREESRAAHVAYGFLNGYKYRDLENDHTRLQPHWNRILDLVYKYGEKGTPDDRAIDLLTWMNEGGVIEKHITRLGWYYKNYYVDKRFVKVVKEDAAISS